MHESGDGYDIIYQSYPQQSNESVPADTISVRLDSQGHIVRQDKISDLSGKTCLDFCKWWQQGRF